VTPTYEIQSILASVVLPVYAEPITWVPWNKGCHQGVFYDGGVRLGIPLQTAVARGADRALVISMSNGLPDASVVGTPGNKDILSALNRSLDLFSYQSLIGEVGGAEVEARMHRTVEQDLCGYVSDATTPTELTAWGCETSATSAMANQWQSSWIFMPDELSRLVEYDFEPGPMQTLFIAGIQQLQPEVGPVVKVKDVCTQVMDYLGIPKAYGLQQCSKSMADVMKEIGPLEDAATCKKKQQSDYTCDKAPAPPKMPTACK